MSNILCIGDVHINTKKTPGFEKSRVMGLAGALLEEPLTSHQLFILGDTFDIHRPTLEDIQLFYSFIETLSLRYDDIRIISGNHDTKTFLYLPEKNFKYYHDISYDDNMCFLGYPSLLLLPSVKKCKLLFTHARCTVPPFIQEEISFELLSKKAKVVILGDIHHPVKVQSNIYYTYEPSRNTYTKAQSNSTGYLIVNSDTLEVTRRHPELPHKQLIKYSSTEEFLKVDTKEYLLENLYKIAIEDYIDNLRTVSIPNVTYELNPKVIVEEEVPKEEEELRQIVNQRVSISDSLLVHTQETYNFSVDVLNQIKKRLREC